MPWLMNYSSYAYQYSALRGTLAPENYPREALYIEMAMLRLSAICRAEGVIGFNVITDPFFYPSAHRNVYAPIQGQDVLLHMLANIRAYRETRRKLDVKSGP